MSSATARDRHNGGHGATFTGWSRSGLERARAASRAISAHAPDRPRPMARGSCVSPLISGSSRVDLDRPAARRRNPPRAPACAPRCRPPQARASPRRMTCPCRTRGARLRLVVARGPATATAPAHDHAAAFMEAAAGRAPPGGAARGGERVAVAREIRMTEVVRIAVVAIVTRRGPLALRADPVARCGSRAGGKGGSSKRVRRGRRTRGVVAPGGRRARTDRDPSRRKTSVRLPGGEGGRGGRAGGGRGGDRARAASPSDPASRRRVSERGGSPSRRAAPACVRAHPPPRRLLHLICRGNRRAPVPAGALDGPRRRRRRPNICAAFSQHCYFSGVM